MVIAVSDGVPGTRETTKIEIMATRVAEGRFTTLPFVRKLAVLIRPILSAIEVLVTGFIQSPRAGYALHRWSVSRTGASPGPRFGRTLEPCDAFPFGEHSPGPS